jgi:ABC-type transporter Mla maintaining outer membrane lipid asymmetry permease subunit MlaE
MQNVALRPADYFSQLAAGMAWMDFAILILKSSLFGMVIAVVTCYHGLAQPLQLEEVSGATVRAVAQGILACVALDALFLVVYLFI